MQNKFTREQAEDKVLLALETFIKRGINLASISKEDLSNLIKLEVTSNLDPEHSMHMSNWVTELQGSFIPEALEAILKPLERSNEEPAPNVPSLLSDADNATLNELYTRGKIDQMAHYMQKNYLYMAVEDASGELHGDAARLLKLIPQFIKERNDQNRRK